MFICCFFIIFFKKLPTVLLSKKELSESYHDCVSTRKVFWLWCCCPETRLISCDYWKEIPFFHYLVTIKKKKVTKKKVIIMCQILFLLSKLKYRALSISNENSPADSKYNKERQRKRLITLVIWMLSVCKSCRVLYLGKIKRNYTVVFLYEIRKNVSTGQFNLSKCM